MIVDIDFLAAIAHYMADGTTASALEHRFRPIKKDAGTLKCAFSPDTFLPLCFDLPPSTDCMSLNFLASFDVDFLQTLRFA